MKARITRGVMLAFLICLPLAGGALAQAARPEQWTVRHEWVKAHENFLAGDALQGRGSATPEEAIAAAYVASQFESFGLVPAPGMSTYLQTATIVQPKLGDRPVLSIAGQVLPGAILLAAPAAAVIGPQAALTACGVLIVLSTCAALLSPAVRNLRAPMPEPVSG